MKKVLGYLLLFAIIINNLFVPQIGAMAEDLGVLLAIDYENTNTLPEVFEGASPVCEIKEGPTGNYMEIQPSWGNSGYRLSSPILEDETEYTVKFDVSLKGVRTDIPAIMLCQTDKIVSKNDNVYHHFGLIKPTTDGYISVAGHTVSGLKYYEDTWYSYEMTFNRRTGLVSGEIYQKDAPEKVAIFDFLAKEAQYGNGMPALDYNAIKFNCSGTVSIDNILICKSTKTPVKCMVTSDKAGNIFGNRDEKLLKIDLRNDLDSNVDVTFDYVIKDEKGLEISKDEGLNISLKALEKKSYPLSFNINK